MSVPDDDRWDDEWNRDEWYELELVDRGTRNEDSWRSWALKLLALAVAVPVVLAAVVALAVPVAAVVALAARAKAGVVTANADAQEGQAPQVPPRSSQGAFQGAHRGALR